MAIKYNDFDVEEVLAKLTAQEKISLLSGTDSWHLAGVPRLGIPAIRTSDGPNGVRGTKFFDGVAAACLPCGTALGATWDTDLVRKGGELMGREAIAKGASVLLGPTVNMQRSPLGGRGFESYSEDPVLAGNLAAASVAGIQSTGVAATLKHFVCNDLEDKRMSSDSILSERALREVYLLPFQIAQRDSKPWAFMTAYNLVNGLHASESPKLLQEILRDEWGFDGLLISDWFGVCSTAEAIKADRLGPAMRQIASHHIDARVTQVLKFIKKLMPPNIKHNAEETNIDSPETAALLRSLAADSLVLAKNEDNVLPFKKGRSTAVIGPNAAFAAFSGGGSASLLPYYAITTLDGIKSKLPEAEYELGAAAWKRLPLLTRLAKTKDGHEGLDMKIYLEPPTPGKKRQAFDSTLIKETNMFLMDYKNTKLKGSHLFYADIDTTFTPDSPTRDSFFGTGTREEIGSIHLSARKTYSLHIEFGSLPTLTYKKDGLTAFGAGGLRLGLHRSVTPRAELQRAAALAQRVDQVVLVAGLNSDWESEGYDRPHMDIPPGSDELIEAVLAANSNTAVIVQSGTPVSMPWADRAKAIVQAWYGGNETGNAIADVVFGDVVPSGKLSLSFPRRNEYNPAYLNYKSDGNRVVYGEGVYVGYRYYEKTKKGVLFPFGHGLSYTSFEMWGLRVVDKEGDVDEVIVEVNVTNTGEVAGKEVVQVYVSPQKPSVQRPVKELKGFTKVLLRPRETKRAEVKLWKKYATSFYHEGEADWLSEKGTYTVLVGNSSASTPLSGELEVVTNVLWRGLGKEVSLPVIRSRL